MTVLILGFKDLDRLDAEMEKLISASQCFLFYVLVGGTKVPPAKGVAERWAEMRGAPIKFCYEENMDKLIWKLKKEADFVLLYVDEQTPAFFKNIAMQMKAEGKHGIIIR